MPAHGDIHIPLSGRPSAALEAGLTAALAGWAVLMPLGIALATTILTPVDPLKPLPINPFMPMIACFGPESEEGAR